MGKIFVYSEKVRTFASAFGETRWLGREFFDKICIKQRSSSTRSEYLYGYSGKTDLRTVKKMTGAL